LSICITLATWRKNTHIRSNNAVNDSLAAVITAADSLAAVITAADSLAAAITAADSLAAAITADDSLAAITAADSLAAVITTANSLAATAQVHIAKFFFNQLSVHWVLEVALYRSQPRSEKSQPAS
jgi:hypothetical protein